MLSKSTIENLLLKTLEVGADFGEIFIETNNNTNIIALGNQIEKGQSGRDFGIGIRLIKDQSVYYGSTNSKKESDLLALIERLGAVLTARPAKNVSLPTIEKIQLNPYAMATKEVAYKKKMHMVQDIVQAGLAYDPIIRQMRVNYLDYDQQVIIANTDGLYVTDRRMKTRLHTTAIASDKNAMQTGYVGPAAMKGFEFYDGFDPIEHVKEPCRIAKTMLHAKNAPAGRMRVIVDNGFGGLLFHEACGHSLEASSVSKGLSEFSGKLGTTVAYEKLSLTDDGSIPYAWGSLGVDDEGSPTRRNQLIKDGVLTSYLVDKVGGLRMGLNSTGSARRENYRFAPTSRMNNTFIESGEDKVADIIKDTQKGIYVKNLSGGSVNPASGEFNFATLETYLVKNGEIKEPIKGATLIGTGGEILKKVDKIADNGKIGDGFCFAQSGALFICAGQPTVRISEMIVGGVEK